MKKQPQLGLVVEGNSGSSAVLRLPKLVEELGPVKSVSLRVGRRLSNMLRAGYAVADYEELQAARLILIRVPDPAVPRIVEEICASDLVFKDLAFALCESWLDNRVLEPLSSRGASIANILRLPSVRPEWFIVEGQSTAVRLTRRFLEQNAVRASEIHSGTKDLYFAAELLATAIPMPILIAAQQALRGTGLAGNHLYDLLDNMTKKLFLDFLKGARITWGGPLTECSAETANEHLASLRQNHPEIAQVLDAQLGWAEVRMSQYRSSTPEPVNRDPNLRGPNLRDPNLPPAPSQ